MEFIFTRPPLPDISPLLDPWCHVCWGYPYKSEERLRKFDYSERIFQERLVVYVNRRRTLAFSGTGDLDGHRIGVLRGWSYGDTFDAHRRAGLLQVEEVASDEQNFQKLDALRLDAIIAVEEAGAALLARFPDILPSPTPLLVNPTHLAFSKTSPQRELLPRFDKALRELRRNGEYARIVAAALGK